jgi:hypothetical protein
MKPSERIYRMKALQQMIRRVLNHSFDRVLPYRLLLALTTSLSCATSAAEVAKTFATPEQAVAFLDVAVKTKDSQALQVLFGPAARDFENPDRVQATNEFNAFAAAMGETNHLAWESATKVVLEVGRDSWPFPIPLVKNGESWAFDAQAGKEEILNRRIGRNELQTLQVTRAYVEAQREYASADRNGDEVLEYAQKLMSTEGSKDGLFWPPDLDGELSPLGPLVAQAQEKGYELDRQRDKTAPDPFHGYFFKILKRQGGSAPGGKYDYVINGHMIAGFALVAWPAQWGQSGVMTFIVNQQGKVYQKDLGPKTAQRVRSMKAYDPDSSWTLSPN